MIKVNCQDLEWFEGMTIKDVLRIKNYTFPNVSIKINGNAVNKCDYSSVVINDGDNIQILHIFAGG